MPTKKRPVPNQKLLVKERPLAHRKATKVDLEVAEKSVRTFALEGGGRPARSAPQFTLLRESKKSVRESLTVTSKDNLRRLIDKVKTLKIALKDQERNIRDMQIELADWRDRCFDLYEFAPVGYVTLDRRGKILESNLTASRMLGVGRQGLLGAKFSAFVHDRHQVEFHVRNAFLTEAKYVCEIAMRKADGMLLFARLEILSGRGSDRRCRIVFNEVLGMNEAENKLRDLTAGLKRRVAAQTAELQLQANAIENLAEGVVITTGPRWCESQIVFVNDAVSRITGYAAHELLGQPRCILHGIESDQKTLDQIQSQLSSAGTANAELITYRKDGTTYYADLSITPLRDTHGGGTKFVSIHRDITERKKAEQTIRESEHRFRQMADHSPVMIWVTGTDKLCTFVNEPWLAFTGRTMEQELGNGWAERIHPEDMARSIETFVTSFDALLPFTMEYRMRRYDGQWRWVLDHGVPHHENGVFVGYVGSCIDVTERRQGEEALRAGEERMRTILNTASDSIITLNLHGIIVAVNPSTERMFGYTQPELIGQHVRMLMPPRRDGHDGYIARYLKTRKAGSIGKSVEATAHRKDRSTFPVELSISKIEQLGLYTVFLRDISVRKQTDSALEQYRKALQTVSAELMLAEERERQRLAQDLHDGLGQALFRARMKLDQISTSDPAVAEIAEILQEVANTVNNLTLELSPPVLRLLGLRPAIRWLAKDMEQRYRLTVRINDSGEDYPLDERILLVLFRTLRELLINVAKHAQTDHATLSLRRSGQRLYAAIADSGKGFDTANQYQQVESGHFGLFSIRERLQYLGGGLEIRSAPNRGTTVTLTVPLATGETAMSAANSA